MGQDTKITWTNHTFNIFWGCVEAAMAIGSSEVSPECEACYAKAFDHRLGGSHWGATAQRRFFGEKYWAKPIAWNEAAEKAGKRASVFCSSMADWAEVHADPDTNERMNAERARLWTLVKRTPWLDWLMLTKRAENLATMLPWMKQGFQVDEPWPNVFPGVTCGARSSLWRIPMLRAVPAAVRFVSAEPLLDGITAADWDDALGGERCKDCGQRIRHWKTVGIEGRIACGCNDESGRGADDSHAPIDAIDWMIVGAESGTKRRATDDDWVRTARDSAARHGVIFHLKQLHREGKLVHLPIFDGTSHPGVPRRDIMKLEREHVLHVEVRALEVADVQLIALCNEALHEPDAGAADRLAEIVERTPDLLEWMRVGARNGYRRATDGEIANEVS